MLGKKKCKILKEIRAQIAAANDIAYVVEECEHKGNCKGTCPRCEQEVLYLEQELEKRRQLGKKVAVAGVAGTLAVSMTGALSGCQLGDEAQYETMGSAPYNYEEEFQTDGAPPMSIKSGEDADDDTEEQEEDTQDLEEDISTAPVQAGVIQFYFKTSVPMGGICGIIE